MRFSDWTHLALLGLLSVPTAPSDDCWPSTAEWTDFNTTVSGQLITTEPVAISCYPGSSYNADTCATVLVGWYNSSFESLNPVGLDYPLNITCPPINVTAGETGSCSLGTNPWYAVNVTSVEDISAAVQFAEKYNIRLVIKTTGHDILGRSDGYGSLEVWLRHFRTGIEYQSTFTSSTGCTSSDWEGSALKLGGGYMWGEVYDAAREYNVVVVGGGSPTVSSTGGWVQGGGHGPASHHFGLGADHILEAEVVLANGSVVTVNACQNTDLFTAIRGGGPSSYGIVSSTTIKAYPQVNATVQTLEIAPYDGNVSTLLDALTVLYQAYPDLSDAGYGGYGYWQIAGETDFDNFTVAYSHAIAAFNQTEDEAKTSAQAIVEELSGIDNLFVNATYTTYPDYWSFYYNVSGSYTTVGLMAASGSRLFDKPSLSNSSDVRTMLEAIAGTAEENVIITACLVSNPKVFETAGGPFSGVLPAWRETYLHNVVARIISDTVNDTEYQEIHDDITYQKVGAMKTLAPNTGSYMNEGDAFDPDFETDYYGCNYSKFRAIKSTYDPTSLFYCPTCVGSAEWQQDATGRLCQTSSTS